MSDPATTMNTYEVAHDQALYLLGFSPNLETTSEPNIDYATSVMIKYLGVEYVKVSGVIAWYKKIDRCDFEGDQGEKNLSDIQWLTPRVIAHERVVSGLSQQFPFYPSRFGTLFSSKISLGAFALSAQKTLLAFFTNIGEKLEWGLKFYGDPFRAAEILAQRDGILLEGKPQGGANYLKLRRLQREQNISKQSVLIQSYERALRSLQSQYQNVVSRPIVAAKNESTREEIVGNLAILVSPHESKKLIHWANDWNQTQISESATRVEITGPWPAYSFCPSLSPVQINEAA
ncbi:MAG: GvpL/GvpF family gas vesicle protein [Planctomycetota bacterium]|nr:GvpL/GvpF family gas vesicle protein [Planctomycetota bacterium]